MHQAEEVDPEAYSSLVEQLAIGQAALKPAEERPEEEPPALPDSLSDQIKKAVTGVTLKKVEAGSSSRTRILTPESELLGAIRKGSCSNLRQVETRFAPSFVELGRAMERSPAISIEEPKLGGSGVAPAPIAEEAEDAEPPPLPPEALAAAAEAAEEAQAAPVVRGDRAVSIDDSIRSEEGDAPTDVASRMDRLQQSLAKDADIEGKKKKRYEAKANRLEALEDEGVPSAAARARTYRRQLERDAEEKKKGSAQRKRDALAAATADKVERRMQFLGKAGIADEKITRSPHDSFFGGAGSVANRVKGLGLQLKATNLDAKKAFEKRKAQMEHEIAKEGKDRAKESEFEDRVKALQRAMAGSGESEEQVFKEQTQEMELRLAGRHWRDEEDARHEEERRRRERVREARRGQGGGRLPRQAGGLRGGRGQEGAGNGGGPGGGGARPVFVPLALQLAGRQRAGGVPAEPS